MPNSVSPILCAGWLQDRRKFERIRWEEAFGEIGQGLRGPVDTYGNEAVHQNYGTGAIGSTIGKSRPPNATPVTRLMNLVGGSRPLCGLLLRMELSLRRAAVYSDTRGDDQTRLLPRLS